MPLINVKLIMKTFLFILLWSVSLLAYSQQVLDAAYLKCQYKFSYLKDTIDHLKGRDDLLVLQIGKKSSKCYSYYTELCDSLERTSDGHEVWKEMFAKALEELRQNKDRELFHRNVLGRRTTTRVYKNYPLGEMTITESIVADCFIFRDKLEPQQWMMEDSTKVILGYNCQKAVCDFRGRHYIAWFAPDVPEDNGPWKFFGLPGLIMEVYDKGRQYEYLIVSLQKVENEPIVFNEPVGDMRYRIITRTQFLKASIRHAEVSGKLMMSEMGFDIHNMDEKQLRYDCQERDYNK